MGLDWVSEVFINLPTSLIHLMRKITWQLIKEQASMMRPMLKDIAFIIKVTAQSLTLVIESMMNFIKVDGFHYEYF